VEIGDPGFTAFCPEFQTAVEIIGRRWSGAILRALFAGCTRFGEVTTAIPGLSDRLLSERLKELETVGIVRREVTPATPVRVEYHLTEKGRDLVPVVRALSDWAERWAGADYPEPAATPSKA
jgi:DNA-binding HxlR family transcriptional regulator